MDAVRGGVRYTHHSYINQVRTEAAKKLNLRFIIFCFLFYLVDELYLQRPDTSNNRSYEKAKPSVYHFLLLLLLVSGPCDRVWCVL